MNAATMNAATMNAATMTTGIWCDLNAEIVVRPIPAFMYHNISEKKKGGAFLPLP